MVRQRVAVRGTRRGSKAHRGPLRNRQQRTHAVRTVRAWHTTGGALERRNREGADRLTFGLGLGWAVLVVDSADPQALARWWAEVYGVSVTADDGSFILDGVPGMPILAMDFDPVPEPKAVKNRIHWDVTVHAVAPLVEIGATVLREPGGDIGWHVLADRVLRVHAVNEIHRSRADAGTVTAELLAESKLRGRLGLPRSARWLGGGDAGRASGAATSWRSRICASPPGPARCAG